MNNTIGIFKRKGPWGGGPIYTKILIEKLAILNYKTIFITDSSLFINQIKAGKKIYIKHLMDVPIKRKEIIIFILFWPIDFIKYFFILLKIKKEKCNILVLQDLSEKILFTPIARIFNIKVIWIEHTTWEPYLIKHPLFILLKINSRFLYKIVTPSRFIWKQIQKISEFSKKAIVIAHGVPKKNHGNIYSKSRIVLISRLSFEKGVDILIKSLDFINPDVDILVIGSGPEKTNIDNNINQLKIKHNIKLLGNQMNPFKYIGKKDLFILPSRVENFSLVLLEALSAGLSIVASDVGGNSEIIVNGKNGYLFQNGNHVDLANKINYLLKNQHEIEIINKNNLNRYYNYFTDDIMINNFIKLIK